MLDYPSFAVPWLVTPDPYAPSDCLHHPPAPPAPQYENPNDERESMPPFLHHDNRLSVNFKVGAYYYCY